MNSNPTETKNKMLSILNACSVERLKEIVTNCPQTAEGDVIFELALNALQAKLSEAEFVAFCDAA